MNVCKMGNYYSPASFLTVFSPVLTHQSLPAYLLQGDASTSIHVFVYWSVEMWLEWHLKKNPQKNPTSFNARTSLQTIRCVQPFWKKTAIGTGGMVMLLFCVLTWHLYKIYGGRKLNATTTSLARVEIHQPVKQKDIAWMRMHQLKIKLPSLKRCLFSGWKCIW